MILFRHADPRYPFFFENGTPQVASRWNADGDSPTQYVSDTPDGAWAEFLRHEGIRDPDDLVGIQRTLWAIEVEETPAAVPNLPKGTLTGGLATYPACQAEASRLRAGGQQGLVAPSAALVSHGANGWGVHGGLRRGPDRDGLTVVLFGERPNAVGWRSAVDGKPDEALLAYVRHL